MTTLFRFRAPALGSVAVLAVAAAGWVVLVNGHGEDAGHTSGTTGHRAPSPAALPGTPCLGAQRVSPTAVATLTRSYTVVIPANIQALGVMSTGWTCAAAAGVFLDYSSGIVVFEEDGVPFERGTGGADRHFRALADDGDGHFTTVAGYPGLLTTPGDGHETKGPIVQFVAKGVHVSVRSQRATTDAKTIAAIAEEIARQLDTATAVQRPASQATG